MITHKGYELKEEVFGLEKQMDFEPTPDEILTMKKFNFFSFPIRTSIDRLLSGEKLAGSISAYQNFQKQIYEIAISYHDNSTSVVKNEEINSDKLLNDLGYAFSN